MERSEQENFLRAKKEVCMYCCGGDCKSCPVTETENTLIKNVTEEKEKMYFRFRSSITCYRGNVEYVTGLSSNEMLGSVADYEMTKEELDAIIFYMKQKNVHIAGVDLISVVVDQYKESSGSDQVTEYATYKFWNPDASDQEFDRSLKVIIF